MFRIKLVFFLGLFINYLSAQTKILQAVKTTQSIKIDGNLDDAAWQNMEPVSDFIVSFPVYGKPASKKTIVKITYDNSAVYVGAYMYDNPLAIKKQLTARDVIELQNTDFFSVSLDTYNDNQNAFVFQVTAAGVQGDAKLSLTNTGSAGTIITGPVGFDITWNAVWESKVSIKKDGWVAELKIPLSAIRFAKTSPQNWGLQFLRFTRKLNESSTWSPEDPNINGTINQWGDWKGLQNITPPLRLSFLPYLSGGVRVSPISNGKNVTEYLKSGGMDVKYGINESFTLDMTLIPDFAQVQSDNVILNLTPFEVKFNDYRPFFTEGTELFNKAGLFYARRIGAAPRGVYDILSFVNDSPQYKIIKNPGITRLYNATKLSGRTKNNLGIGVLNALGASMRAEVKNENTGETKRIETEPLTNYNIIVLDQAFKNKSSVTFTNTNVLRNGNRRNANVTGLDLSLYDKKNVHGFFLGGRYSAIWGNEGNKSGFRTDMTYKKVSGKLQYAGLATILSNTYDPNDLGFLSVNNSVKAGVDMSYNIFKASKRFLNQQYAIRLRNSYLYKPFNWGSFQLASTAFVLLKNFWDITFAFESSPLWSNDFFEARTPGKVFKRSPFYYFGINGSTDSRKKLFINYLIGGAESPLPDDPFYNAEFGFRYRFSDRFQMNISSAFDFDKGNWGYAFTESATAEPVIARRRVRRNTTIAALNYNFNARMNLSIRMRHYWSQVLNRNFYHLKDNGYWNEITFVPGKNQNFNTFNVDMFYTWDFLLGSRIIFAWKNALGSDVNIDGVTNNTYFRNFNKIFNYPHSNEVTLKVVYYLDYLRLQRH